MRTRPASIATIVIALGLALTSLGLARQLPFTVGGAGSRLSVSADLWAHGTGVSPALVALVVIGLLAAIAMRPTRGGQRAASWLAVLAGALIATGLMEPAQRDAALLISGDAVLSVLVLAFHVGLTALILSCVGEARGPASAGQRAPVSDPRPVVEPNGGRELPLGEPVARRRLVANRASAGA